MGVHGLWELLAPAGRRVSVETLAGKKLAIDASIWMVQFMKAMRDEKGEMVRNAHLLGFFRRICKLLYLKTKPVFVFDGATPVLKRRTVIARRRQRENAQAKIRKTAEKLLLNHIKQMRLKELSKDLKTQRKKQKNNDKGKKVFSDKPYDAEIVGCNSGVELTDSDYMKLKDISEMPVPVKDGDGDEDEDEDEDEEIIISEIDGDIDPDVLAALPKSMQRQILSQKSANDKKISSNDLDQSKTVRSSTGNEAIPSSSYSQEKLDEMLAASLAELEDSNLANSVPTSTAAIHSEEYVDVDEDEEMILPAMHGNVDPAVLAALPPSLQLDLLVQMREMLMAENRQKYQKVKKAPEKFSELQIQSYLKTVAFRREIDEVQRAAAGRGVAGVQTSRIASEANREFIFSSSFTGDKQVLTSVQKERDGDTQQEIHSKAPSGSSHSNKSICKSDMVTKSVPKEPAGGPNEDVGTYLDERGRVRVSKVRGMGMRMTRDLQRNLDLMKEIEQERTTLNEDVNMESVPDRNKIDTLNSSSIESRFVETSHDDNCESINLNVSNQQSVCRNEAGMEITFEDDGKDMFFDDDADIFARLAAGDPVVVPSPENKPSGKQASDSGSDCEWEEGMIEGKWNGVPHGINDANNPSNKESNISEESEVEWEEEPSNVPKSSSGPVESVSMLSKGYLEEEADLQEAMRRSLIDSGAKKSNSYPSEVEKLKNLGENMDERFGSLSGKSNMDGPAFLRDNANQQNIYCENLDSVKKLYSVDHPSISDTLGSPETLMPIAHNSYKGTLSNKSFERSDGPYVEQSMHCANTEALATFEEETRYLPGKCSAASNEVDGLSTVLSSWPKDSYTSLDMVIDDLPGAILDDKKNESEGEPSSLVSDKKSGVEAEPYQDKKNDFDAEPLHQSVEIVDSSFPLMQSSMNKASSDIHIEQELSGNRNEICVIEAEQKTDISMVKGNDSTEFEFTQSSLDDELQILGQEYMNLGDEQRKLERNAESVSSEMFAECQELLQMFGLPYIIAPMEAEAQCAYLELTNLVDGVVTDDSDVFLFGARSIYKNIFDDRKYVETYFMQDVEKELGLSREKLIRMALLLGSDYTEGVSGIGIVNAIEIVNAFPEEDGLKKFHDWIESPDPAILGKLNMEEGSNSRKRGSKLGDKNVNIAKMSKGDSVGNIEGVSSFSQDEKDKQSADCVDNIKQIFMDNHRNVSKNWHIPSTFPSEAVISAYSSPQVDKSTEPFTWGKPDVFILRKLCWEKFGWGSQKSDELLLPVLREYEKRETQLRLEAFYTFNERFAKIRSKRIKKAVKGITGNQSSGLVDDDAMQQASKSRKKNRVSQVQSDGKKSVEASQCQSKSKGKSLPEISRKRQNSRKQIQSEISSPEPACRQKTNKQSPVSGRRGRNRKRKAKPDFEQSHSDTSSSDSNRGQNGQEVDGDNRPQEMRRSLRSRNPVNYTMNDLEDEADLNNEESSCEKAKEQEAVNDQKAPCFVESGGGFCLDESEIGQPDASEAVEDYLTIGGGFCLEESETTRSEDPDSSDCFGVLDGVTGDRGISEHNLELQIKEEETSLNGCETAFVGGLRAMPSLKRKRRKR